MVHQHSSASHPYHTGGPSLQQAAAAQCRLVIVGRKDGTLHQASMNCTGSTQPTIALNTAHLRRFEGNFRGVKLAESCPPSEMTTNSSCLMTICSGSLVLRNSRVSWVRRNTVRSLVCVADSSRLEVHNSRFTYNQVGPLVVDDQAVVVLQASNVSYNIVNRDTIGGGLMVGGNAHETITDGSRVQGNLVGGSGGGLAVRGNARLTITDGSRVHSNAANGIGGGLVASDNADIT